MISDEKIDGTLEWLQKNATKAAQARANRIYLEEFRKSLKAILMSEAEASGIKAVAGQERNAYADERYISHLDAMRESIIQDEKYRWEYVHAQAEIEAWRTYQANNRIQARIG